MKDSLQFGSMLALIVGVINLVLISSTDLNERAYSWLFEFLLNLSIAPGIYISLALESMNMGYAALAAPTVIITNMGIYFIVGYILGALWTWVKDTA